MEFKIENRYQTSDELSKDLSYLTVLKNLELIQKFKPQDNFMPCVYGSPDMMIGKSSKNNAKQWKSWLLGVLIGLGISACIILLILILINL